MQKNEQKYMRGVPTGFKTMQDYADGITATQREALDANAAAWEAIPTPKMTTVTLPKKRGRGRK